MKIHSGNVFVNSANEGFLRQLHNDSSMRTNKNNEKHYLFTQALGVGFLCQAILVWVVIVIAVKNKIKEYINNSKTYSFQFYGYPCGLTAVALLLCTAAVLASIRIITTLLQWPEDYAEYTLYVITIGVWVLPGMPITAYFAYKNKPPPIPYIIMIPVALLFCCCNSKRAKSLVFGVALWINMIAAQIISFTATILIMTVVAEPLAIITNSLVLVLGMFCVANIFCLSFHSKT